MSMLMRVTYFFGHASKRVPIDKEGNIGNIYQDKSWCNFASRYRHLVELKFLKVAKAAFLLVFHAEFTLRDMAFFGINLVSQSMPK